MKRDDILWKTVLEDTFDDFLRFFIPNADDLFDLNKNVEYLDKELLQLFPPESNDYKPKYVDKLVKVYTRAGTEEWVLIHVEVQGYKDDHFDKRMFQYYTRIWDKYDRSIAAFAIFTDADSSFRPMAFQRSFLGTVVTYTFNTCKILDLPSEDLALSANPFALVALTVKSALLGKHMDDRDLLGLKLSIAKRLINSDVNKVKIRKTMTFLRYYIRFESQEMTSHFDEQLSIFTSNDRTIMGTEEFLLDRAKREGMEEGFAKAKTEMIQNLLNQNGRVND